ncbi:hypothetical protein PUMCH_000428 [Australozyma saopauloensis]|uniref:Karyogamy protein KAR4 n=1 Tax=Australozyma saopauloensis TaxID=291208 RepID=A0AAX4H3Q1_9ASCO|nr:hypothetical protein PUMCH_000428 [[Candida] saopauloensis]
MYSYPKYGSKGTSSSSGSTGAQKSRERKVAPQVVVKTEDPGAPFRKASSYEMDYSNHYIHTGHYPTQVIRNVNFQTDGYPKLQKLKDLKEAQVERHATKPFGAKVQTDQMISVLNKWASQGLQFDVIMIGALVENQFIVEILNLLPLFKLCAKPGFVFIWATTANIKQLTTLLNGERWNKKFRRSEELVFVPVDDTSEYFKPGVNDGSHRGEGNGNNESLLGRKQWHCWMCITGTARRSTDTDLIHCNVDTDLQIEPQGGARVNHNDAVPETFYKVVENFSNSTRRLHIVPCHTGYKHPVRVRPGWVVMLPDVILDNFDIEAYEQELHSKSYVKFRNTSMNGHQKLVPQYLVAQTSEIETLRPKSPN